MEIEEVEDVVSVVFKIIAEIGNFFAEELEAVFLVLVELGEVGQAAILVDFVILVMLFDSGVDDKMLDNLHALLLDNFVDLLEKEEEGVDAEEGHD